MSTQVRKELDDQEASVIAQTGIDLAPDRAGFLTAFH
jgi:hypothetical protein